METNGLLIEQDTEFVEELISYLCGEAEMEDNNSRKTAEKLHELDTLKKDFCSVKAK